MSDEQLEEYRQMMVRLSTQRVIEPSDTDDLLDAVALLIAEVKGQTRRAEAAEAQLERCHMALGLLSTLHPTMSIDVGDPLGMAKQIEAHVQAALAAVDEYVEYRLSLYNDDWGLGSRTPMTFAEWLRRRQEVQP